MEFVEVKYISPSSNYNFSTVNTKYYMIITCSAPNGNIYFNKIELNQINNITEMVKGYNVGKYIGVPKVGGLFFTIKIFAHNLIDNSISLLFSGNVEVESMEYHNIKALVLYEPSGILDYRRKIVYHNDIDFINEIFYNYETMNKNNVCVVFLTKSIGSVEIIKAAIYDSIKSAGIFVYNRYNTNIVKEIPQSYEVIQRGDYYNFVKWYGIDVNRYNKVEMPISFSSLVMRRINIEEFRKQKFAPYLNGLVCAASDGRTKIYNNTSFVTRLTGSDYPYVMMPYEGIMIEKSKGIMSNGNHFVVMKFVNNYYMPPSVQEREYISVLLGHRINNSKLYPELLVPQPDITLLFTIIMIGNKDPQSVATVDYVPNSDIPQGTEIGSFNLCFGTVYCVFNRELNWGKDLIEYSGIDMECYIHTRDIIGVLL